MKFFHVIFGLLMFIPCSVMTTDSLFARTVRVDIEKTIQLLIQDEDTDGDKKITIDDFPVLNTGRGDKRFIFQSIDNTPYEVCGTYYLANLLGELVWHREEGEKMAVISPARVFENPVKRTSRMIRERYWQGLTRRIDADHLSQMLQDTKISHDANRYLYVSHNDRAAWEYFSNISRDLQDVHLNVVQLPETITPEFVNQLQGRHGLLSLKLERLPSGDIKGTPFVVPGGRFNEMYGWDSYFEALGLIVDGKVELAKAMVENFVYEIEHYGKILNANRTYYLTRSQPPFLTSMGLAVYEALPKNQESKTWLKTVLLAAVQEYHRVWMNQNHRTEIGLNRYYGTGLGIPPEVEPGHFDFILKVYAQKHGMSLNLFAQRYRDKKLSEPELDQFFIHDRAVRESGHDTTYRWSVDHKDRCADFATVDLNALLYKYEIDIAMMLKCIFNDSSAGQDSEQWYARARKRKELMLTYLWNESRSLFFDLHIPDQTPSDYISATIFYPLWACDPHRPETKILSDALAEKCIKQALSYLESRGGVSSSAKESVERYGIKDVERQWDYPYGWAPHQMLIWKALDNYGYQGITDRLIYKWLYTILINAVNYNGTIPEKYDVVKRSHKVFAEYGNVGTTFSYLTKEGFGWTNASFQAGLEMLSDKWIASLENLVPPEWIDFE